MKKSFLHSTAVAMAIALSPAIHAQTSEPVMYWTWSAENGAQTAQNAGWGVESFSYTSGQDYATFGENNKTPYSTNLYAKCHMTAAFAISMDVRQLNSNVTANNGERTLLFLSSSTGNAGSTYIKFVFTGTNDTDPGALKLITNNYGGQTNNHTLSTGLSIDSLKTATDWQNLRIVSDPVSGTLTLFVNGQQTGVIEDWNPTQPMRGAQFGSVLGGTNKLDGTIQTNNIYFYNLAILPTEVLEYAATFYAVSLTTLGSAQHDAMTSQLNTIRNRVVGMAALPNTMALPVQASATYSLWLEATGGYAELQHGAHDSAGYDMSSYGGILGGNVSLTDNLIAGAALAVDYGKVRSHLSTEPGASDYENSTGHLDAYYLNLFARYQHDSWAHLLVLTGALQQADMDRTVQIAPYRYFTSGSTNGYGLAAMYELTYDIALNESNSNILQPLLNLSAVKTHLNGYTETVSDPQFNLNVGAHDRTTYTAAVGARWLKQWQSSVIGRPIITELRATVSQDFGDDRSTVSGNLANDNLVSFIHHGAKAGKTAGQIGLGISVPSHAHGSVFANVNGEWRSNSYNVTGSVGYRYDF